MFRRVAVAFFLLALAACGLRAEESATEKAVPAEDQKKSLALYEEGLKIQDQDLKTAVAKYQEALKLDPANTKALNHYAWFLGVTAPAEYRDAKKALELATKAVELTQWKNRDIIDTVAEIYFLQGDYKRAVELGKKALEPGMQGHAQASYFKEQLAKFEAAAAGKPALKQ